MGTSCGITTNPDDTPNEPSFVADGDCSVHPEGPVIAGGPIPDDADSTVESPDAEEIPQAVGLGIREFQSEFETTTKVGTASTTRRPDSISFDYLTAFSVGPIDNGDSSGGATNRVWRVRAVNDADGLGGAVYLSRANDANTAWEAETLLFAYLGLAVEVDLAFEQAARPVVALEIAGHIWIYWFDPTPANFVLDDLTTGRTPRLILDDVVNTNNSDVLLFYCLDGTGLRYRQQRDRYGIELTTPINDVDGKFLEDVFRTTDNRVAIVMSVRNSVTGKYSLERLESTLYPFFVPEDNMDVVQAIQSGELLIAVIAYDTPFEEMDVTQLIQSGILSSPIIDYTAFDEMDVTQAIQSGILASIIIIYTAFDNDALDIAQAVQSGILVAIVINYTAFDEEALNIAQAIQSGTLAP